MKILENKHWRYAGTKGVRDFVQLNPVPDILIMNNWWKDIILIKTITLADPYSPSLGCRHQASKIYKTAFWFLLPSICETENLLYLLFLSHSLPNPATRHDRWIDTLAASPPQKATLILSPWWLGENWLPLWPRVLWMVLHFEIPSPRDLDPTLLGIFIPHSNCVHREITDQPRPSEFQPSLGFFCFIFSLFFCRYFLLLIPTHNPHPDTHTNTHTHTHIGICAECSIGKCARSKSRVSEKKQRR